MRGKWIAVAAAGVLAVAPAGAHDGGGAGAVHGPADEWVYPLARPGTYELPVIGRAADASLLDENGAMRSLSGLFGSRATVVAFVYTRCGDVCPMASAYMAQVRGLAAADPAIGRGLSLVSISFDPQYDTPQRMREYAGAFRADDMTAPQWHFLTAPDEASLQPVLDAYGQPVKRKRDEASATGPLSHLMRVFLIDAGGNIRNIYSADFLDPRLVINDLLTIIGEG